MVFGRNFCDKQQIWVSEPHFGVPVVRDDARPWLMARWKTNGQLSIRINCSFFRYLLQFQSYEAKCVQLGCFHRRVDRFALKFYLTASSPIKHSWHQKTRGTGLPDGKDRIPLRSLVLTQYQRVTDGQTDMP